MTSDFRSPGRFARPWTAWRLKPRLHRRSRPSPAGSLVPIAP